MANRDYDQVKNKLLEFRDDRHWQHFHTYTSLARALSIEASEVEKVFQWQENVNELTEKQRKDLELEVADVLTYAYYLCAKMDVNPNDIVQEKLDINQGRHWVFDEKKNREE